MLPYLEEHSITCIFPAEVTSRFWRDWTAMHGKAGAVRSDRFVSWDTFIDQWCRRRTGKKPADTYLRTIAARMILEEHAGDRGPVLKFFVPGSAGEECRQFTTMISALLPRLMDLDAQSGSSAMPSTLRYDIRCLLDTYRRFLDAHGFFEPSYELHALTDDTLDASGRYAVFFPELIPAAALLGDRLQKSSRFICVSIEESAGCFSDNKPPSPKLQLYNTSASELAELVSWIEGLLSQGVSPGEIHVSLGDYENWIDPLQEETQLRGIPAAFHLGRRLNAYPGGRFFHDLHGLIRSDCSLESVKKLLINRFYPWKLSREFEEIAVIGIRQRCIRNTETDIWAKALAASHNPSLARIWKRFTGQLRHLITEDSPARLRELILTFIDTWLTEKPPEFALVFDYALHRGLKLLETCEAVGVSSVPGLFSLWLQVIQESRYVPQQQGGGVSFYPYGLAAGTCPKHHALAGLSSKAASVQHLDLPYVSEDFAHLYQLDIRDLSRDFLSCSLHSGADVRCSMARESFSGPALPPPQFLQEHRIVDSSCSGSADPFSREMIWWEGGAADITAYYPVQLAGLAQAMKTHMVSKRIDLTRENTLEGEESYARILESVICSRRPGYVSISPTSLDAFTRCPFLWLFTDGMKLPEEDLLPRYVTPLDEGTVIHACLHQFFMGIEGPLRSDCLDTYREMIEESVRETVERYAQTSTWCISAAKRQLTRRMLTWLVPFVDVEGALLNGWESPGLELSLSHAKEDDSYVLSGRIDRLAYHPETGGYAVIDYKRSSPITVSHYSSQEKQLPSYQLPFYALLAEADQRFSCDVIAAAYYDVIKQKYKAVYDRDSTFSTRGAVTDQERFASIKELTASAAAGMAEDVRAGRFPVPEGFGSCKDCRGRMLCRRRYHVQ